MKKNIKHLFTNFNEFVNESNNTETEEVFVTDITFEEENLKLFKYESSPFDVLFYLVDENGETYVDLNTTLETNKLLDAIWVKKGDIEEQIADLLPNLFKKTDREVEYNYNTYILYNL